jgi:hypothetical protein
LLPGGCGSTSCPLIVPGCSNPGCVGGACPGPGVGETNGDGDENNPTSSKHSCPIQMAHKLRNYVYLLRCFA